MGSSAPGKPAPGKPALEHSADLDGRELQLQCQQLHQTVLALRERLEAAQAEADRRLAAMVAEAEAEKRQLKAAIDVLRQRLEEETAAHGASLQRAKADAAAEIRQLQESLVQQRTLLDALGLQVNQSS